MPSILASRAICTVPVFCGGSHGGVQHASVHPPGVQGHRCQGELMLSCVLCPRCRPWEMCLQHKQVQATNIWTVSGHFLLNSGDSGSFLALLPDIVEIESKTYCMQNTSCRHFFTFYGAKPFHNLMLSAQFCSLYSPNPTPEVF